MQKSLPVICSRYVLQVQNQDLRPYWSTNSPSFCPMLPAYDTSTATRHLRTFWKLGLFGRVKTNSPRSKVLRVGHNHHPCTANSKAHHRKQLDDLAGMEVAIWAKGVKLCRTCRMLPTSCLPCKVLRLTYLKPAKSLRHCQVVNGEKKRLSKKWWTIILPLMNEIINNSTKECDQTCLPAFCSNSNYHHSSSFVMFIYPPVHPDLKSHPKWKRLD